MKRTDDALTIRLATACTGVIPAEQALELARNLATRLLPAYVALLGPVTASEWTELVNDALDARQRPRCGSAWLLSSDLRVRVQAALLAAV